jgi:CHAT domain-containing protein
MAQSFNNDEIVRDYMLGRIADEKTLEEIEARLFDDEDFCAQMELAEDEIINDYVLGLLSGEDAASFESTLAYDPERRFKLELTKQLKNRARVHDAQLAGRSSSFFNSVTQFFRKPAYAGAFAVLLIGAVILGIYLTRSSTPDDLAELKLLYQQSRPTESRISNFDYAPLTQLRGPPDEREQNRLRRIENDLILRMEQSPNAQTHHALGIFRLTQHKHRDAVREFEAALKFNPNDARIHNDLGSAHFELAKSGPREKKLEELARSLEEFTRATQLDTNLLEALFNRSLALQELGLPREARESWTLYLQKDPSSAWADEARKHLAALPNEQTLFKSNDQVLSDFSAALRQQDYQRAQNIHNETKGLLRRVTVPLQLSRRYLAARRSGDDRAARDSIDALMFVGNYERTQHNDAFFFEFANFYSTAGDEKIDSLIQSYDLLASAEQLIGKDPAGAISLYEQSRDRFVRLDDRCAAVIAENWAAQLLRDVGRIDEARTRLIAIAKDSEANKFLALLPAAYYWLAMNDYSQGRLSESARNLRAALRVAESAQNVFEIQHAEDALAKHYAKLGELEQALFFSGKQFSDQGAYYHRSAAQYWRDRGTLAELTLKLGLPATSLSISREMLSFAEANRFDDVRRTDSLDHVIEASMATNDLNGALQQTKRSLEIVQKRGPGPEATVSKAEIYRLLGDINRRGENCSEALGYYDQALQLYEGLPAATPGAFAVHKGKLQCFQASRDEPKFVDELAVIRKLADEYRQNIREDTSRQAFFANQQDIFDAATESALRAGDNRRAFALAEDSKARSLLQFVSSLKSIAEVENSFADVAQPLDLLDIQKRFPEETQLVQYAVLPERLAIWTVSKTQFDFREQRISARDLEQKIVDYQALVVGQAPARETQRAGRELYDLLIPPALDRQKPICIVGDKFLHQLSFAALISREGKYLLEEHVLFYSPSASIFVLASENARRKSAFTNERVLSVGNPAFDREANPGLPDLPAAEDEAKSISGSYAQSVQLLGPEATRQKFLSKIVEVEVAHFAGHFVANSRLPANSKLLFADVELRSAELGALKLPRAKLVVLSACETGYERYNRSEGAIGIARTFLALGAPVVVASQWKVETAATRDLMIAFHRGRKHDGMTSAESLRQAQLEVLRRPETSAPFYWAAFSLFGGHAKY